MQQRKGRYAADHQTHDHHQNRTTDLFERRHAGTLKYLSKTVHT